MLVKHQNFNKKTGHSETVVCSYPNAPEKNHSVEYKNWNKDKNWYDYELKTYADHTVESKNYNKDCVTQDAYYNATYTYPNAPEKNCSVEYKNWNKDKYWFDYKLYTYSDRTVEWNRADGTYCDVDIKDKSGKVIAYDHIIRPLQNGTRDIEVLSGGVVYQYFGVTELDGGKKFIFKSCTKIENGKKTEVKGATLSREEFYMDSLRLL